MTTPTSSPKINVAATSSRDSRSNMRVNAIWLMNAAALTLTVAGVVKSSTFDAKATDFYWAGLGSGNLAGVTTGTTTGNWWTGRTDAGTAGSGYIAATTTYAYTSGTSSTTVTIYGDQMAANVDQTVSKSGTLGSQYNNLFFGAITGTGSTTINTTGNVAAQGLKFVSGASAYTFTGSNQRKIDIWGTTTAAAVGIINESANNQTFNLAIRNQGGYGASSNSTTASGSLVTTIGATGAGKLILNGTKPASYVINKYAVDYYMSAQGGSMTQANAVTAAQANTNAGQALALSFNSKAGFVTIGGTGTVDINGTIDDATRLNSSSTVAFATGGQGNLIINSTGTTNLSGFNTYTGTTQISGGTVNVKNVFAFGGNRLTDATIPGTNGTGTSGGTVTGTYTGFSTSTISYGAVSVANGATVDLYGTTMMGANAMTINGSGVSAGGVIKNSQATGATYVGAVTLGSASTINAASGDITLSGALSGSTTLTKAGSNTLNLSGDNSGFSGGLSIGGGKVSLAGSSGSANSANTNALSFTAAGTLALGGRSASFGAISASDANAIIENDNASNATLTSTAATDTSFAGVIRDRSTSASTAGTLALIKAGSGTLTLSGANTYTGNTTISAGTIKLSSGATLGSGSAVTLSSGATLQGAGSASGTLSISGTVNPGDVGVGTLTNSGNITLNGGGVLNIQFNNSANGAGTGWDLLSSSGSITVNSSSGSVFTINLSSIGSSNSDTAGNATFDNANTTRYKLIAGSSVSGFDATKFSLLTNNFTSSTGLNSGTWSLTSDAAGIYALFTAADISTSLSWSGSSGWVSASGLGGAGTWSNGGTFDSSKLATFGGTAGDVTVTSATVNKGIAFQVTGYALNSGTITVSGANDADNSITTDSGVTATVGSAISSAVKLNKEGAGTLVLSGDNSAVTGGLSINAGTIKVGSANALGASSSAVTVATAGILDLNGTTMTAANALSLSGSITNSNSNAATYAGNVTLGATKSIGGALVGDLTLAGGIANNGFALTLNPSAKSLSVNGISGTGNVSLTNSSNGSIALTGTVNNTGTITNDGTGTNASTISGNLGAAVTGVTQNSTTSALVLSGDNTNYVGGVTVTKGTLKIGSSSTKALGANSSNVSVASTGTLDLNGNTSTLSNALALNGGTVTNSNSTGATYGGLLTLGAASTINAASGGIAISNAGTITGSGFGLTVSGNSNTQIDSIIGTGAGTLSKSGSGTLTLNGANTFTGNTTVSAGTLKLGRADALASSTVTLTTGGALDLNANTVSSAVAFSGTTAALSGSIINSSSNAATYSGTLGTLAGSATINASSGNINITGATAITIASGKTLTLTGSNNGTISSQILGSVTLAQGEGLIKRGTGTWTLSGSNTSGASMTATTGIYDGVLKLGAHEVLSSGSSQANSGINIDGGTLDLNGYAWSGKRALVKLKGTGYNNQGVIISSADFRGGIQLSTGSTTAMTVQQFINPIQLTGDATIKADRAILFTGNATSDKSFDLQSYNLTLGGSVGGEIGQGLNGSGKVIVSAGTWTLNPSNSSGAQTVFTGGSAVNFTTASSNANFTGGIDVTGGSLKVGSLTALGTGAINVTGGNIDLNGKTLTATNALTLGGGSITNSNTNAATYAGLVSLTANSTINAASGGITIGAGGTILGSGYGLTVSGDYDTTITSAIGTEAGTLTKNGAGTLTLNGTNTYSGNTSVDAGTLKLGTAGALGSSNVTVAANGALNLNGMTHAGSNTLSLSGSGISGAGALTNSSTNAATFAGNVALAADAAIKAAAGSITLSGQVTGSNALTVSAASSKSVNFTGANANTFSSLTLAGGDVQFSRANQLGSGSITSTDATSRLVLNGTSSTVELTNDLNTGSASTTVLALAPGAGNTITASGLISGSGQMKISGSAASGTTPAGILVLSNTSNSYTGGTEIGNGTLRVADDRALGNASGAVNFSTVNSKLEYTGSNTTSRDFTIGSSAQATTAMTAGIDVAGSNTVTLNGSISNKSGSTAANSLTKTGNGALILGGTNSYTGATTVSAGSLTFTGGLSNTAFTVSSGASATVNYTFGNTIALTGALTLSGALNINLLSDVSALTAGTYDAITFGSVTGGSNIVLAGTQSNADWVVEGALVAGKYQITVRSSFTPGQDLASGSLTVPAGKDVGEVKGTAALTVSSTGTTIAKVSSGSVRVSADTAITDLKGGAVTIDSGKKLTVSSGDSAGTLSGSGQLAKTGNGTLKLSGDNSSFTGTAQVAQGTLEVTSAAALGGTTSVSLGAGSSANAATLKLSAGSATEITANISALSTDRTGSGNVIQNSGTGALTLSGTLDKNGTVLTLNGGTSGIIVTKAITGASTGDSDLVISGGTTTLNAVSTYSGPTYVNGGGTLVNGNSAGALPTDTNLTLGLNATSGTFDLNGNAQTVANLNTSGTAGASNVVTNNGSANATLTVSAGGTFAGKIQNGSTNSTALTLTGGTLALSGSNTYSGATNITGGVLEALSASAIGSGTASVASNAVLSAGDGSSALTLTTGGYALSNGAILRVYIGDVQTAQLATGRVVTTHTDYAHGFYYDQSSTAGTNYSYFNTLGNLDVSNVTAGGITIELYNADGTSNWDGTKRYNFTFMTFGSSLIGADSSTLSSLFTFDASHLYNKDGGNVQNWGIDAAMFYDASSKTLTMSIPEPSTYGLGLGALALAFVAIRRRQVKAKEIV